MRTAISCRQRNATTAIIALGLAVAPTVFSQVPPRAGTGETTTVIPYDDKLFLKIGNGFDLPAYVARHNSALNDGSAAEEPSGPTLDFALNAVTQSASLINNNSVSVSAEARYLTARGNMSSVLEKLAKQDSASVHAQLQYVVRYRPILRQPLKVRKDLCGKVRDPNFIRVYGTHAVIGVTKRASIDLSFDTTSLSKSESLNLIIKAGGSFDAGIIAGGTVSGEMRTVATDLLTRSVGNLSVRADGLADNAQIDLEAPTPTTDLASWSLKAFNALQKASKVPRYDEVLLMPYANIPCEAALQMKSAMYPDSMDVATVYALAKQWRLGLSIIEAMKDSPNAYDFVSNVDRERLIGAVGPVRKLLATIETQLKKVSTVGATIDVPTIPAELATLPWPRAEISVVGAGPENYNDTVRLRRPLIAARGGNFRWVRLTALPGSTATPEYSKVTYDLNDRAYHQQYGNINKKWFTVGIEEGRTAEAVDFSITLGRRDLNRANGPFLVELVSADGSISYASVVIR